MTPDYTDMKTDYRKRRDALISAKYSEMKGVLYSYIRRRIDDAQEAEDILQEAFTKLLESGTVISEYTLDRFIYRIIRNLITDWYRRHACSLRAQEYFAVFADRTESRTENEVAVREMLEIEQACIGKMGKKKGEIYLRYIHGGENSTELSRMLNLSRRTIENHIFSARKSVREAFRSAM